MSVTVTAKGSRLWRVSWTKRSSCMYNARVCSPVMFLPFLSLSSAFVHSLPPPSRAYSVGRASKPATLVKSPHRKSLTHQGSSPLPSSVAQTSKAIHSQESVGSAKNEPEVKLRSLRSWLKKARINFCGSPPCLCSLSFVVAMVTSSELLKNLSVFLK